MADHKDLHRTIAALRREVAMRPEWRSAVLRDIDALPAPESATTRLLAPVPTRSWTIAPGAAIAAALLCAIVGGGVALGVRHVVASPTSSQQAFSTPRNSARSNAAAGVSVRFLLVAPAASNVAVVGDFNGWRPSGTPMRRSTAGLWTVDVPLRAGRHTYAFLVDGVLVSDPDALDSADDDFGVPSSVVLVSDRRT